MDILQKICYAKSEEEFQSLCNQLERDGLVQVTTYFKANWLPIRKEWVLCLKAQSGSFLNTTNNRLESVNGKLKQVISKRSTLEEFVDNFFVLLCALCTERDHKGAVSVQKVKVCTFTINSPEYSYSRLLAAPFVFTQLSFMNKVRIEEKEGTYSTYSSEGITSVTSSSCQCMFYNSMLLPCRHILALRAKLGITLFESDLCDKRWTLNYYQSSQRIFTSHSTHKSSLVVSQTSSKQLGTLSTHEKFRKASFVVSDLASVISEASNVHYERRMELVKDLIERWKHGEEVGLMKIGVYIYIYRYLIVKVFKCSFISPLFFTDEDDSLDDEDNNDVLASFVPAKPGGQQKESNGIVYSLITYYIIIYCCFFFPGVQRMETEDTSRQNPRTSKPKPSEHEKILATIHPSTFTSNVDATSDKSTSCDTSPCTGNYHLCS